MAATRTRESLPERSREALELFERGLSTKEIAGELGITPTGVYQHKRRLMDYGLLPQSDFSKKSRARAARKKAARRSEKGSPMENAAAAIKAAIAEIDNELEEIERSTRELRSKAEELQTHRQRLNKLSGELHT